MERFHAQQSSKSGSLCEKLQSIIKSLPQEHITLLEIRERLGQEGMLLLIALLTIVFLIPVSIPGVSTVFGGAILCMGISVLVGKNIWMPSYFLHKKFPAEKLRHVLEMGLKWFVHIEKISKPHRLIGLTNNKIATVLNGCSLVVGALLLMMPFGFIPLSNTLPALALLCYSIGMLQKDGVTILLGHVLTLLTIGYFALLISGGSYVFYELLRYLLQ